MVIQFLTGIGILLFGVNILSTNFEKLCGSKMKYVINKYSSNRASGAFFGGLLTIMLTSSSAGSILISGLAGAGVLTLLQSIALIMGTNIGGALSLLLVAFQSINLVAYFGALTFVGVFMRLLFKNEKVKTWGNCLCGFGLLFTSLSLMSSATASLKTSEAFLSIFTKIDHPALLVLIGIAVTAVLQSSHAVMAILASLLGTSVATSVLSVYSAAFIVYGMNIGTCVTLLLVGALSNKKSLRTALCHILFNIFGCILFSLISIFDWVTPCLSFINNPAIEIILVDIIFNTTTCLILICFQKPIAKLLTKIVPDKKTKQPQTEQISSSIPTLAIVQLAKNATILFDDTSDCLERAMLYVTSDAIKNSVAIRKTIDETIKTNEEMYNALIKLDVGTTQSDTKTISKLHSFFVGIKKTNVNIQKLLNSAENKDTKYNFTQKQEKVMHDITALMNQNLEDMKIFIEEDYLGIDNENTSVIVENIISRLEKIVIKKIEAKQSIVQSSKTSETSVAKYTAYLNVINYFEQINTNLTDIIIAIISAKPENNLQITQQEIDKLQIP
ncbi:MAG: Na/Pi cotransporter family protein [Clostridia bacterium]|nr:Na/Pi cotransporter family protein [Clostridia bacterium]